MSQLEYQSAFPPGSFFHNQALAQQQGQQGYNHAAAGSTGQEQSPKQPAAQHFLSQQQQLQLQQQALQQQRPGAATDGMYNASSAQSAGLFPSASYSQPSSAGTALAAAQQQAASRHSASPHQPNSPYTAGTSQAPSQQIRYPMAAPPLPHTPINTQQPTSTSTPSTPLSPNSQNAEQSRIKLILEINADLLEEISSLQAQGKGGLTNAQKAVNKDDKIATDEYIQTLRRVQANLAYLAPRGNVPGSAQKQIPGPAHMTPPPQMPQLQVKYDKLRELFPGWSGMDQMQQAGAAARANMNGTPS